MVISVEDGGRLDNDKGVKVMQLDREKKITFNFQVTGDPGIFRLLLTKGKDSKVVQFWVGALPAPTKKIKTN